MVLGASALVAIDRIDTLSFVERNGVIRSMIRKVRLIITLGRPQDFTVLSLALEFLDEQGLSSMSTLEDEGYSSLVLVERAPQLAENDPGCVDVTLRYEHILDGPNQQLISPPSGLLFGKGRCSITEKTTNFYWPYGDHSQPRIQILTAHTFPSWEVGVAGLPLQPAFPMTVFQGGEVTIPFPQANFQLQGILQTENPWVVGNTFIASVNDDTWLNQPAFTWICSEVQWDVLDIAVDTYRFSFEFQYNVDTWFPTVVFNDQRTGRPPANVRIGDIEDPNLPGSGILSYNLNPYPVPVDVGGPDAPGPVIEFIRQKQPAGYWTVPALKAVDFSILFCGFWEGAVPPSIL